MPIIRTPTPVPLALKEPSSREIADKLSSDLVRGINDAVSNAMSDAMALNQSMNERSNEAIDSLKMALAKSGNKVVKATVERDKNKLITAITMQVISQ